MSLYVPSSSFILPCLDLLLGNIFRRMVEYEKRSIGVSGDVQSSFCLDDMGVNS